MKKLLTLAICASSLAAYALPTYEPFTEFTGLTNTLLAKGTNGLSLGTNANYSTATNAAGLNFGGITNAVDLATGGFTAPGGETWTSQNFSGTAGTGLKGVDIAVISNATIFTQANLTGILPANFPGMPAAGQAITNIVENAAQPGIYVSPNWTASANIVGNSAVLNFANDITRPTNGITALFVSYLLNVQQQGQLGTGNDGRYLEFLAQSNLVEPSATYSNWTLFYNNFNTTSNHYAGHGIIQKTAASTYYIGACDSSKGQEFTTAPVFPSFGSPVFVVGAYVFNSGGKDTNLLWANPVTSSFGGPLPPTVNVAVDTMPFNMTDIGGLVIEDRVGSGASGGVGTNYMANLIIGTTWSYVTGGPEFTVQPIASTNILIGGSVTLTGTAVAAAQSVTYQWQKVTGGVTNNLSDGTGTAGGTATVSGSLTQTLSLNNCSGADLGTYQLLATASGTALTLPSSPAAVVSDPLITANPQPTTVNFGNTATFTANVTTAKPTLSFQWFNGSTPLSNGTQADGSSISGASGTISGGSDVLTLTINNVSYLDDGNYSVFVTNNVNNSAQTTGGTLTVNDPYIVTQPANPAVVAGGNATFTVVAAGSPTLIYQWFENGTPLFDNSPDASGGPAAVSGSATATLTLTGVQDGDNGTYTCTITGSASTQTTNTTPVVLIVQDPLVIASTPKSLAERTGDHVAFAIGAIGGGATYQWSSNSTPIPGATGPALVLTNIQPSFGTTYSVTVSNLATAPITQSATLTVINSSILPLSSSNLVVVRVGDGAQALSSATGNTIYLDQFTTNGTYLDSAQIPDEGTGKAYGTGGASSTAMPFGSPALIASGLGGSATAGGDAFDSPLMTLSGFNQQFLCIAGYCEPYPFSAADVTVGATAGAFWRGLATINAFGVYTLAYTNSGLFSGGNHTIRAMTTIDGTNFWTSGQAGAGSVKFVNSTVTSYATGNGIPSIANTSAGGCEVVEVVGPNLVFPIPTLVFADQANPSGTGLYFNPGPPEPGSASSQLIFTGGGSGAPVDFAFSPDGQTVYIADAGMYQGSGSQAGGIQRWDTNAVSGGGWVFAYTLPIINGGTNGAEGLAVSFPTNITSWGPGVTGAVIYATSTGTNANNVIAVADTGSGSLPATLMTAGLNQSYRGLRFGPAAVAVTFAKQPGSVTNFPGNNVTFTASGLGSAPIFYQWQYNGTNITGATLSTFTTNNISFASAGNYSVTVSNLIPSSMTSSNAVLTVTAGSPAFTTLSGSVNEEAGDHTAFAPVANGTQPISAQWYFGSLANPIVGATNIGIVLTNISPASNGSYLVVVSNVFGSATNTGTLTVTASPTPLNNNNLIVSRMGDGIQPLSAATGNTIYLDQYTPSGAYVSSIQVPDEGIGQPYGTGGTGTTSMPFGSGALLVTGAGSDAPFEGLLTRSTNGQWLDFVGYVQAYPFNGPDVTVDGTNGGLNWRGIGEFNVLGTYSMQFTNTGLDSGGPGKVHSTTTADDTNYYQTGEAGSAGLKFLQTTFQPANGGGLVAVGASAAGTRMVQVFQGNLWLTDAQAVPPGLYEISGTPSGAASPFLIFAETNSPIDFAVSPDGNTVYVSDNNPFVSTGTQCGGIERWDNVGGTWTFAYTLGTGTGSSVGTRAVTVDFSAQSVWGAGVTGAKVYATTAEAAGNRLIKITDTGASSAATTLTTANPGAALSGVRFGLVSQPVNIVSEPQNTITIAGNGAVFTVGATGTKPLTYQWQTNGVNLAGATASSLTVSPALAASALSYTVVVSNLAPSVATSSPPAIVSVVPEISFNAMTNGEGFSANVEGGSGIPLYNYNGSSNAVELTQSVSGQGSSTFFESPVYVGGFLATWTYQLINPTGSDADGTVFVVQNDPRGASALGAAGGSLGYGTGNPIVNSLGIEFNVFAGSPLGGVGIGLGTNGSVGPYVAPSPVNLASGDPINVTLQYLNGVATLTLVDATTSDTFTTNQTVNVPSVVGGNTAYVGFTGADGGSVSTQVVSNFVYLPLFGMSTTALPNNKLALTWPTGVGAYMLQQTGKLGTNGATSGWVNSAATTFVTNNFNETIVNIGSSNQFYRLVVTNVP